jgi:hypothetical protein
MTAGLGDDTRTRPIVDDLKIPESWNRPTPADNIALELNILNDTVSAVD